MRAGRRSVVGGRWSVVGGRWSVVPGGTWYSMGGRSTVQILQFPSLGTS